MNDKIDLLWHPGCFSLPCSSLLLANFCQKASALLKAMNNLVISILYQKKSFEDFSLFIFKGLLRKPLPKCIYNLKKRHCFKCAKPNVKITNKLNFWAPGNLPALGNQHHLIFFWILQECSKNFQMLAKMAPPCWGFLLFDYAKLPFKRVIRPPIKESLNFFGRGPQKATTCFYNLIIL